MSPKMTIPNVGEAAPGFCLPDKDRNRTCLADLAGRWVVLYFYPKDNTSGCTLEAMNFTAARDQFAKHGAAIVGVSPDSPESHCRFADKHGLGITLLSDAEHDVMRQYGVWQLKKMYGRESWGVVRSTFLVDPHGVLRHEWRKVKVRGHVDAVKAKLLELQEA